MLQRDKPDIGKVGCKISMSANNLATADKIDNMQRARGHGELFVKRLGAHNRLERLYQEGCARLRMPKHNKSDPIEAVMINTSGGLTDNDHLSWKFAVEDQAQLTITSQACERIYKASRPLPALIDVDIKVGKRGSVAWLPQETILFDQAQLKRTINVGLSEGSEFLMVEPLMFGRPAMDEVVSSATLFDSWRIYQEGLLIHAENQKIEGDVNQILKRNTVTSGDLATAFILYIGPQAEAKFETIKTSENVNIGASIWQITGQNTHKLIIRMSAPTSYELRKSLIPIINALHGQNALPKVWHS